MRASQKDELLMARANRYGISLTWSQANTLRRAEKTLQRWAELECGTECGHIQRDEATGIPYMHYGNGSGPFCTRRTIDREAGALRRVAKLCADAGLHFYHQSDPRGAALYISKEPLPDNNYSRGLCCAID